MNKLLQHIIDAGDVDHRVLPGLQKAKKHFNAQKNPYLVFAQEGVEYKGPSIVDYLATKGYSGKKAFRKELADKYGIEGYDFSAAKNTELLNRLRESDELLRQYDQTMAPVPVERMMEMEQQARAARQAAAQRPANPAPVYNFSPEFQNMRIPQTKINTSLQPKVIFDGKFSLKPKMVIPMPFGFNKTTPAPEVSNTEITDPVRNVPSRLKLNLPQYNPFARPEARPELGPFISERYNDVQEVDPLIEQGALEFLFNSEKLFNSFNRPEQKPLLPVIIPAKKPVVKTEKYTKPEVEELPWYEEAANAVTSTLKGFYDDFAESVNNSPYDFRQVNFGTGMSADGAKEMTRELTRKGLGLFSPDLAEKYNNWLNRQQAIQNMDKDPVSKIVVPDFDYAPMYITGDTIPDSERQYHLAESMDLNALKFGVRNRGDLTPLDTEAASITAFHPFVDAKLYFTQIADDPANATYLGITPDGQVQVGGRKDVENKDVKITRVFSNKVVDFVRDPTGGIKKVPAGAKVNKNAFSPAVTVIGDDGKQKEGKLNLVVPQGTKADDAFGVATGGRFIFQTPDGQSRLVSGSLNNIEQEFKRIKGNNPYVTVISLDNGSFSRGLRTRDKRLTATDLRSYDNLNTGGGNFAYLLPNQQTSRPLAKFDEFEKEATKRLQALYPGKKVSVEYQDTGLYNQLGGRDIQTQADIQKKGNSQTGVSLHNFNAARDYVLYVDGKPINGDEKNKAGNDIYKEVLWKAADKTGVYHIDPWDVGHIGLAKEGQKTAFDELKAKYPEIFTDPNFVKSLEFINKNKNNPNYQEYYELLNNIQKFTGAPRTTEFMKRSGTAKKAYGGPVDLPKAQWGQLVNPITMGAFSTMATKLMDFFGLDEPKIVRTPASAPKRLSIRDPRKVMMTSGKPLRPNSDLVSGDYDSEDLGNLLTEAKRRKMSYNDMMNLAAMGFQETKWGKTDPNIGHTMDIFGDDPNPDPYENFINAYDAKMKDADRLKIKDEATRLQVYNGLGKVFPSTEADYHGFKMKKIYGVDVPKGGIDLRKNPLYGKQIIDIRDNVLKRNPEFMRYMDSTYRAPMPKEKEFANGGLFKMQKAGQNNLPQRVSINDPRYAELYKNRQVGSFYDDAFSLPDLDEVTVSAPRSYSMESLRDFTNASLYGAPVNTMKIAAVPQAAMTEGVEMLRGKPYSFSNVNPNLGSFGSNQRDLSMTMGYENPQGFLQNAANVGLSMIDPSIIAGGSALLRQPIQRGARAAGRFLTTKTPLKNTYKINPLAVKEPDVILTRTQKPGQTDELRRLDQFEKKGIHNLNAMERFEYKQMLNSELSRPGYGRGFSSDLGDIGYYSNPNIQDTRGYEGFSEILKTRLPAKEAEKFNVGKNPLQGYISFAPKREYLLPKDLLYSAERFTPTVQGRLGPGTQRDFIMKANAEQKAANIPNWLTGYPSVKEMGGPILDPRGQWAHPGKRTIVPTPTGRITMQDVPYPVYGQDETGFGQMMYPGGEYKFPGQMVDEIPIMQPGGSFLPFMGALAWKKLYPDGYLPPLPTNEANRERKFLTDWNNSAMGKQMLYNSVDKDDPSGINSLYADKIIRDRDSLIKQAKVNVYDHKTYNKLISKYPDLTASDDPDSGTAGYASRGKLNFNNNKLDSYAFNAGLGMPNNRYTYFSTFEPKNDYQIHLHNESEGDASNQTLIHELGHASDASGYLMPISDEKKIKTYSYGSDGKRKLTDFQKYVADPSETRARLLNFRYNAKNQGIYNPFTQKATFDSLKKYEDRIGSGYDPLEQLREVYTDSQIVDMLNTISKKQSNEVLPFAKNGGYTVTRSNDRKGKTHKVTGPDGTVKYFGDSKLGQHPKDPERKAAFYARHKKNLAGNPFFRAFARKTWEDGGQTDYMQGGGLWDTDKVGYLDSTVNANRNLEFIRRAIENDGLSIPTPKGAPGYGKGMTSSHLMTFDPKSKRSYPELVNMNGTLKYLTGDDAYNYAEDTGEYIQFPTAEQADYFSQNYKKSNYVKVGKQPLEKKHGIKVTYKK